MVTDTHDSFVFQAINGSGKTGAFAVASLMRVDVSVDKIQVVILANTRELIRQIHQVMSVIGKHTGVKLLLGAAGEKLSGGHVLITVPGYIHKKLINTKKCDLDLSALKMLVLDEADELYVQDANEACFQVLKDTFAELKIKPQHCCYSATYPEEVIKRANYYVGEFRFYPIRKEMLRLKGVKNYTIQLASEDSKLDFIVQVHVRFQQSMTMIFVNKKDTATKLQKLLATRDVKATILVGGLETVARDRIIDSYRKLEFTTLIATNVLARGIDVPEVDLVISFDVPQRSIYGWKEPDYANFMHRVGRTGRYGTDGLSVTLMQDENDTTLME